MYIRNVHQGVSVDNIIPEINNVYKPEALGFSKQCLTTRLFEPRRPGILSTYMSQCGYYVHSLPDMKSFQGGLFVCKELGKGGHDLCVVEAWTNFIELL